MKNYMEDEWQEIFKRKGPCEETYQIFRDIISRYYLQHRRDFSWREELTPYRVFVSEVMLQQTQTKRVVDKFSPFVEVLPDFKSLAGTSFSTVLQLWKGLGYNRRAKFLQEAARIVVGEYAGDLPEDPGLLVKLPGIGPATAASVSVFAFNRPWSFIETNIRTVFIHFFFQEEKKIHDSEIMPLVRHSLDHTSPREWYYALMDYGVMLKKTVGNLSNRSSHYKRQSRFEGSDRQIRGKILQLLLDKHTVSQGAFAKLLDESPERCLRILEVLCHEGIIKNEDGCLTLV